MFDSHQKGTFGITFENGVRVSVVWKPGTYSDNHDDIMPRANESRVVWEARYNGTDSPVCTSSTAELMITEDPTGRATRYVEKLHGNNPAGYLTPRQVLRILNQVEQLQ